MDIRLLDVSAVIGLFAAIVLTINILLGMLLSTAYKRSQLWKKMPEKIKAISLDDVHNWTAYVALALVLLHPLFLILDKSTLFFVKDVLFPVDAPKQKWLVALGTISLYALIVVIVATQKAIKKKMTFRAWKNIHLISYITALLFVVHGIFLDPELKDRPVDFLDGEKLVPELCGIILMVATIMRYRYHLKKKA
jgi:DMSO/TMAO reductase YedYZ heme-binding membrane subunit